mmetsp:Transcript_26577/g.61024  ORF Transcript_26577/g.61024 Transcript_26577/m.61024 type:complete len:206 (-) Transcript_26577:1634-2251(-)
MFQHVHVMLFGRCYIIMAWDGLDPRKLIILEYPSEARVHGLDIFISSFSTAHKCKVALDQAFMYIKHSTQSSRDAAQLKQRIPPFAGLVVFGALVEHREEVGGGGEKSRHIAGLSIVLMEPKGLRKTADNPRNRIPNKESERPACCAPRDDLLCLARFQPVQRKNRTGMENPSRAQASHDEQLALGKRACCLPDVQELDGPLPLT